MISHRPCDHWVAASALAGVTRSIWIPGSSPMTSSLTGGSLIAVQPQQSVGLRLGQPQRLNLGQPV